MRNISQAQYNKEHSMQSSDLSHELLSNFIPKELLEKSPTILDHEAVTTAHRILNTMSDATMRSILDRLIDIAMFQRYGMECHAALSTNTGISPVPPSLMAMFRELPSRSVSPSPISHLHRYASGSVQSDERLNPPVVTTDAVRTADEAGFKALNQYVFKETLGKGTTGKVKLAYDTDRNTTVAIKILRRQRFHTNEKRQQLQREIAVMKRLRHKNLVSLYEVIDDAESEKLYLVMQYVDDGPLLTVDPDMLTCVAMDAAKVATIARQLCAGLAYLHTHRIVHRDIKPDNILKGRDGTVYLCDFGLSEEFEDDVSAVSGWKGSPLFMAPEVHALQGSSDLTSVDGYAADVYSLGVSLYLMLTGRLPFSTPGNEGLEALSFPPSISSPWQKILRGMLHPDVLHRTTLSEVRRWVKSLARECPYETPVDRTIVPRRPSVLPLPSFRLPSLPSGHGGHGGHGGPLGDSDGPRAAPPRAVDVDGLALRLALRRGAGPTALDPSQISSSSQRSDGTGGGRGSDAGSHYSRLEVGLGGSGKMEVGWGEVYSPTGGMPRPPPLTAEDPSSPPAPLRITRSVGEVLPARPSPPRPLRRSVDPPASARGGGGTGGLAGRSPMRPHVKAAFHHLRPLPLDPPMLQRTQK